VTRIQFQNLLVLGLSWNKIENIESLVYLDAPMLRLINLDSNSIRTVSKSLNKLLLKSLRSISLESNPIY
jgi:Leucine-rich repeat (LRR) protein